MIDPRNGRRTKKRPNSIVLTDWGAYADVYRSPRKFITDLIMLSLLYDTVLIQDEVFVLSDSLPKWFDSPAGHALLNRLFELDSVVLLAWPARAYTKNIATDPKVHPLFARAEWHVKNSTRGDELFVPSESHKAFYKKVEAALAAHGSSLRERGTGTDVDVGECYRKILRDVLGLKRYEAWLRSLYPDISEAMRSAVLEYIDRPSLAVRHLTDRGFRVNALIVEGAPVFNRSLGFQVSRMYGSKEKRALQQLMQSAYAIPLCESEEAVGRYGRSLKEVPWCSEEKGAQGEAHDKKVMVEAVVDTNLWLPDWSDDFPSIINRVRSTKEGKALRRSVRSLGNEIDFRDVTLRWREVADLLASSGSRRGAYTARNSMVRIGTEVAIGTIVGCWASKGSDPLTTGLMEMLGTGVGVVADHIYKLMRNDLLRQALREKLQASVEFRCNWIPFEK